MNKPLRKLLDLLQHGKQTQHLSRTSQSPALKTPEEWHTHWNAQNQPWRTEPEIDKKRQEYLAKRRLITPNIEQGIYPFKGEKLSRADVEWLLATHENGRGPIDWSDESQRERKGVDLRGADLHGANLTGLPLARIYGGLALEVVLRIALESIALEKWIEPTGEQWGMAAVCLEGANLGDAQLQGASLGRADLQGANLMRAQLQGADLLGAQLQRASLWGAQLQGANLTRADLQGAGLMGAQLQGADLLGAQLQRARLFVTQLQGASLKRANLEDATLDQVKLSDEQYGAACLVDANWRGVNLSVVAWEPVTILGDEQQAEQKKDRGGETKGKERRLSEYESAVRANRQLAIALQRQGLNEDAVRFAYRAQVLQRHVFWLQMLQHKVTFKQRLQALQAWLFSWFLFLLAGYGYRVWRSFAAYVLVIGGFATTYYLLGPRVGLPLSCVDAIVFSMTSFHGRGFSPGENIGLSNPLTILAAIEAFVGLVIEVTLIATLTQRFFGK